MSHTAARRFVPAATAALLAAACSDPSGPRAPVESPALAVAPSQASSPQRELIPGQYIVVLRAPVLGAGASPAAATADAAEVTRLADKRVRELGGTLRVAYARVFRGYAASGLSEAAVRTLRASPDVAYVEQDQVMHASATQSGATWGIDRIDQRALPLSGTYTYTSTGSGVRAYIIDTGIQTSHPQFGGRASAVYDAVGDGRNGQDCNGHGTHVAGTVGSSTYGVAKGAYLRAVRVLSCSGSGSNSGVIAGINWVAQNHIAPAVANLSLGGGASTAVDQAINALATSGVFVAVAAGNEGQDACNVSPARAANATTVAASTRTDARATYSNYGGCVDLYAPGSSITSTWIGSSTNTISGTSMATPHVAGVAALYKATYGDAPFGTIRSWLTSNATANVITGNPSGTPNLLLYKGAL